MALIVADRVRETSTTSGTGTVTLNGAVSGFQSFSVIGNANSTYYTISGTSGWEVGIGTYTLSGTTLSRDTVLSSSNSGSKVSFGSESKDVFVTYPSEIYATGLGGGGRPSAIIVNGNTVYASCTIASGTNGFSVGPIAVSSGVAVTVSSGQRWLIY